MISTQELVLVILYNGGGPEVELSLEQKELKRSQVLWQGLNELQRSSALDFRSQPHILYVDFNLEKYNYFIGSRDWSSDHPILSYLPLYCRISMERIF